MWYTIDHMADGGVFDLILFGYRNDLARAQTLEFLDQLPPSYSGPTRLDPGVSLPQRLFAALERASAEQLCTRLEALGAQVALLQASVPSAPPLTVGAPATADHAVRPFTLFLVLALAASAYLWQLSGAAHAPASAAAAPWTNEGTTLQPMLGDGDITDEAAAARLNAEAIQLAASGNFGAAVDRLHNALRLADHPVLTRNLQSVLLNWGIVDLNANRLEAAVAHLEEAAQMGERTDVLRALGVSYARQGDSARAAPLLERALQMERNDTTTLLVLADVYLKQDKRPQALELLQHAKEAGATGADLDKKLQQVSREVDAEWGFAALESPHFKVSFADDEDRSTVKLMLDALEDAYGVVGAKFNSYPARQTTAVLYTQRDFHTVTQTPHWAGAAFDGRMKFPVRGLTADNPNLLRVVRHEYAHSLVASLTNGRCPVWLNEGLAVWAEEDHEGERAAWAESRVAGQRLFSLDELSRSFTNLPADRVEVAYAESYLAVRSLIDRYGARTMPTLLTALSSTGDVRDAFASVYPADLARFQEQLLRQLHG